ncbi:MAG: ornithine carbamoyltransferase [Hyphomonadaceae bacterium]|jgi:ornithine carbamoyltransferase|nr:ornithine carbamoyltransferase [Hyphomonadaceae bacterium]
MTPRHFLDIDRIDARTLRRIIDMARIMKKAGKRVPAKLKPEGIADAVLMLIFEKPSTRTRVSFDVAMRQLGGQTLALNHTDLQIGRGEPISDTAKVLSRYVDAIMVRANKHETLTELAEHATVPVINGLTDRTHPCQIAADILTFEERLGPIKGRKVAWSGDGNNVAASWIQAAARLGFKLSLACPPQLNPERQILDWAKRHGGDIELTDDPEAAVAGADCVVTDTWVSMGQQEETRRRKQLLAPYAVNARLMSKAARGAIFMHCLPAYRGNEVAAAVIDGPQSAVWDEAENRLHAQKAILAWCLGVD